MSRIALLAVMLCGVLAGPVLGVWRYKGTDVWISEPDAEYDPEGTWYWMWDGEGSVSAGVLYLEATGWTRAEAYVQCWPYFDDHFQNFAYVSSWVSARSHYEWEGSGSKNISYTVHNTVDNGSGLTYQGMAVDDTHVNTVDAASGADARASSSVTNGGWVDSGGYGYGEAITQSGASAQNGPIGNPTVSEDTADSGYPPPYLYNQWYDGSYQFTADEEDTRYCNWDQTYPSLAEFHVDVNLGGTCFALGNIEINDPDYYYLRLASKAIYFIGGETHINLYGNIE
jgi:hypothetical protein